MGKIQWILLYFSNRTPICSIFVCTLNPVEHSPPALLHFALPITPDQLSEEFYFIFSPLSQPGFYSLLLLVCFPHPIKIIFSVVNISHSLLYNILIPIPPLSNFIQLSLQLTLMWFYCSFAPIGQIRF